MIQRKKNRGLTLVEAMVLLVILSIVAVAAGVGLQAVVKVPAATDSTMAVDSVLVSVQEQTRANLIRNWPASTWGGSNYAFIVNGTSYSPTAGITLGSTFTTPITGSSPAPITVNNKTYQISVMVTTADPGVGSAQADFIRVTVKAFPVINGAVDSTNPQKLVAYVAQP